MTASLILASASTARSAMLRAAGVEFTTIPAQVDEAAIKAALAMEGATPVEIAETLAETKATQVAIRNPTDLVIGANQVLAAGPTTFDKPADIGAARDQLRHLSGRDHTLHSAVCLVRGDRVLWHHNARASLSMRDLSEPFLDQYLAAMGTTVCNTVGGYQIEGLGAQLFRQITGDYFTILGLPLLPLLEVLRSHGVLQQ